MSAEGSLNRAGVSKDDDEATLHVAPNVPPHDLHTRALPCIQVLSGSAAGLTQNILPQIVFGRHAGSDAVLEDDGVSRSHTRVFLRGREVWVEDLKSTNGTHLRGAAVEQALLADGDIISIGPVLVKFTHLSRAELELAENNHKRDQPMAASSGGRPLDAAGLSQWIDQECATSNRQAREFTLILADVEDFGNIMDTCGKSKGELLMRQLTQVLRSACQPADQVERYAEHTFAIVLRDLTLENSSYMAERLQHIVSESTFPVSPMIELQLTLKMGLAHWDKTEILSGEALIGQASAALLKA